MSRVGRSQSASPKDEAGSSDGKILGLDRNTAIIVGIVLVVVVLVVLFWRSRSKKDEEKNPHHIINNGCKTDAECPTGKHCKVSNGLCVECTGDSQCAENANGTICNPASNKCVQCALNSDCEMGQQCINHVCSPALP
jgi:preprotein translocase subunit SecG